MAEQHKATATPDLRIAWGMNDDGARYAERAYREWMHGAETLGNQALEYWTVGVRRSLEAMNEMARCETAAEAFGVQARYASETVQDLLDEGQKVVQQLAAFTQTPWATVPLTPTGGAAASPDAAAAQAEAAPQDGATAPRSSRRRS